MVNMLGFEATQVLLQLLNSEIITENIQRLYVKQQTRLYQINTVFIETDSKLDLDLGCSLPTPTPGEKLFYLLI